MNNQMRNNTELPLSPTELVEVNMRIVKNMSYGKLGMQLPNLKSNKARCKVLHWGWNYHVYQDWSGTS